MRENKEKGNFLSEGHRKTGRNQNGASWISQVNTKTVSYSLIVPQRRILESGMVGFIRVYASRKGPMCPFYLTFP